MEFVKRTIRGESGVDVTAEEVGNENILRL